MNQFRLCYVDSPWAYFTTQIVTEQWGDDWNDAPYEHNAGIPYTYRKYDKEQGRLPWEIKKVAFNSNLETPAEIAGCNSHYSVEQINKRAVAWLTDRWGNSGISILAGTTLEEFKELIKTAGGSVFEEVD